MKFDQQLDESTVKAYLEESRCHYTNNLPDWKYSCYLFYLLSNVMDQIDLNSQETLSISQLNAVMHSIQECSTHSLEICINRKEDKVGYGVPDEEQYQRLISCLRMFHKFFGINMVSANSLFDDSKLDYIIGVLTIITLGRDQNDTAEFLEIFSNITDTFTFELVFKFMVMIKGFSGLSKEFQMMTQRELTKMIRAPNGFLSLCKAILVKPDDVNYSMWMKHSVIYKITAAVIKTPDHRELIVDEIFQTLDMSLQRDDRDIVACCVYVLRGLEESNLLNRSAIVSKLFAPLASLTQPDVFLAGAIVMERAQLENLITRLNIVFSTSIAEPLPSLMLQNLYVALFNLYSILPDSDLRNKLGAVIVFFMANRDQQELQEVVRVLRLKENEHLSRIHSRVCYKNDSLQISAARNEIVDECEPFLDLLRNSNNNFLIYDTFLALINILGDVQGSGDNFLTEFDVSAEDLPEMLHQKFFKKLAILEPLQEMIQWRSLHTQLNEKPEEVLEVIKNILEKCVERESAMDEALLSIFFSIFKELMSKLRNQDKRDSMKQNLQVIKEKCKNPQMRAKIEEIVDLSEDVPSIDPSKVAFNEAIQLLNQKEPYFKTYGADTLIKLIKKGDQETIRNQHMILALALQNLRNSESYTFLSIIRLLVALSYVMDAAVIDALVAEFQNTQLEIDDRLKVGETIVKVTESLGQLAVKFKDQLINCFLRGSRDANNEFRTSALANLGTVCKVLSYDIHKFFHEMLQQLELIIKSDEYLPSKRAATMVLSHILAGLPNLMDFQDFLLPIYRLLKDIIESEGDEQTKTHASVGLEHLNAKTKDFLNPQLDVAMEIRIRPDENPNKLKDIKYK